MTRPDLFSVAISSVMTICVLAVLVAVWLDFKRYNKRNDARLYKRSAVATGVMLLYFALYYLVLRMRLGVWVPRLHGVRIGFAVCGTMLVALGAAVNLWGRAVLKQNWANHIKIYKNHTLVTHGPFRYVRHPLYSSLFCMFYGGSLAYGNWLGLVLTSLIFVPMMRYRAKQEEVLLSATFSEYGEYQRQAGRFFPNSMTGYGGKKK